MKYLLLLLMFTVTVSSFAQDCNETLLAQKPGTWKEGLKGSTLNVSAADLVKEKTVLSNIHKMITAGYNPKGCQVLTSYSFSGAYLPSGKNWVADNFCYNMYILRYLCDKGNADKSKFYVDISTPTTVKINANVIYQFNTLYAADLPDDDFRGYLKMNKMPQKKDGYYFLGEEVVGDSHLKNKIIQYTWLITYDDKLPFSYITRKDYLLIQKKRMEQTIRQEGSSTYYDQFINRINDYLKKPESELSRPAICMWNDEEQFTGFVEEGSRGSFIAVKPNPGYYNKTLPKSIPQFFTVVYTISHGDPVFEENITAIKKTVDFAALKNMLGKGPSQPVVQNKISAQPKPTAVQTGNNSPAITIYKNEATPGFVTTPLSQIKNVAQLPVPVNSKIKSKALSILLTSSTIADYINQLLSDVEKNLNPQQTRNTQLLYAKFKSNPVNLADAGVMLYYKGAVNEALWCLSKAAAMKPASDYIVSNLTGIMNLAQAEARALPLLRYLKNRHPNNTTVLNNLGQAFYLLGEMNSSKAILDSCIRIYAYHPQANFTRAIIAEKEGKNAEATLFIQKSLKNAYSEKTNEFAQRKGIRLDYSNLLNRYRPTESEYINPMKFRPPAQCTNVFEAVEKEALWDEWTLAMQNISSKIKAGLEASSANYQKQTQQQLQNKTSTALISLGPLHGKAEKLYKVYFDKAALLQQEAQTYYDHNYKRNKEEIEKKHSELISRIEKKYSSAGGEGIGSYSEERCKEINAANNTYLEAMAGLNNAFNQRFAEPMRQLNIEMMYWSQLMPWPTAFREMTYYDRAMSAVNPMQIKSMFIQPCMENKKGTAGKIDADLPDAYCPISFKFKVAFAKLNGDCGKFEIELEFEGLVLNLERDFINKKSTIAFGAGLSLGLDNKVDGVSQNVIVGEDIPVIVELFGAGVGAKMQGFIEIDATGISDVGLRGEAAIEGPATDKGDIKINGKIGVNSGVDITPSPALENIGKALNETFLK